MKIKNDFETFETEQGGGQGQAGSGHGKPGTGEPSGEGGEDSESQEGQQPDDGGEQQQPKEDGDEGEGQGGENEGEEKEGDDQEKGGDKEGEEGEEKEDEESQQDQQQEQKPQKPEKGQACIVITPQESAFHGLWGEVQKEEDGFTYIQMKGAGKFFKREEFCLIGDAVEFNMDGTSEKVSGTIISIEIGTEENKGYGIFEADSLNKEHVFRGQHGKYLIRLINNQQQPPKPSVLSLSLTFYNLLYEDGQPNYLEHYLATKKKLNKYQNFLRNVQAEIPEGELESYIQPGYEVIDEAFYKLILTYLMEIKDFIDSKQGYKGHIIYTLREDDFFKFIIDNLKINERNPSYSVFNSQLNKRINILWVAAGHYRVLMTEGFKNYQIFVGFNGEAEIIFKDGKYNFLLDGFELSEFRQVIMYSLIDAFFIDIYDIYRGLDKNVTQILDNYLENILTLP